MCAVRVDDPHCSSSSNPPVIPRSHTEIDWEWEKRGQVKAAAAADAAKSVEVTKKLDADVKPP